MIQYEKDNNISLNDIIEKNKIFQQKIQYDNLSLPFSHEGITVLSAFQFAWTWVVILGYNLPEYTADTVFPLFGIFMLLFLASLAGLVIFYCIMNSFKINIYKYFDDLQIKHINSKWLIDNEEVPDVEKEKTEHYNYLRQTEVRVCLINEIDNTLLIAKHYQHDNKDISKLEELKKEYLSFSFTKKLPIDFLSINHDIIQLLNHINDIINELSDNKFYTDYIKVSSTKPEHQLRLLDTVSKYKEIL